MSKAYFKKPWPTFVEDIEKVQDEILVYHYTPDNMSKQGRRRILIDGKRYYLRVMLQEGHCITILTMVL